jgi:hypothetical protein
VKHTRPQVIGAGFDGGRFAAAYFICVVSITLCGVAAALAAKSILPSLAAFIGCGLGLVTGAATAGFVAPLIERKHLGWATLLVFVPSLAASLAWVTLGRGFLAAELAAVPCATAAIVMSIVAKFAMPNVRPPPDWICCECGYDLRGTPSETCPECGTKPMRTVGDEIL